MLTEIGRVYGTSRTRRKCGDIVYLERTSLYICSVYGACIREQLLLHLNLLENGNMFGFLHANIDMQTLLLYETEYARVAWL